MDTTEARWVGYLPVHPVSQSHPESGRPDQVPLRSTSPDLPRRRNDPQSLFPTLRNFTPETESSLLPFRPLSRPLTLNTARDWSKRQSSVLPQAR